MKEHFYSRVALSPLLDLVLKRERLKSSNEPSLFVIVQGLPGNYSEMEVGFVPFLAFFSLDDIIWRILGTLPKTCSLVYMRALNYLSCGIVPFDVEQTTRRDY